jgi:hypothetical protein
MQVGDNDTAETIIFKQVIIWTKVHIIFGIFLTPALRLGLINHKDP